MILYLYEIQIWDTDVHDFHAWKWQKLSKIFHNNEKINYSRAHSKENFSQSEIILGKMNKHSNPAFNTFLSARSINNHTSNLVSLKINISFYRAYMPARIWYIFTGYMMKTVLLHTFKWMNSIWKMIWCHSTKDNCASSLSLSFFVQVYQK